MEEYIKLLSNQKDPTVFSEKLLKQAHEGETILLGLRQLKGVKLTATQQKMFFGEIQNLVSRGLVKQKGDLLKLSKEGLFLANQVFMAFVGPFEKK